MQGGQRKARIPPQPSDVKLSTLPDDQFQDFVIFSEIGILRKSRNDAGTAAVESLGNPLRNNMGPSRRT